MDTTTVVKRLRAFLLGLSAWLCAGTIVELFLAKHTEDPMQFVPFVLCGVGLVALVAAWRSPRRATLLALRGVMGVLMLGSLLGVYEHLAGNVAFELDIRPGAAWSDIWFPALRGAAPLLAPGILAVAALLAIAATYAHPMLARRHHALVPAPEGAGEISRQR